MFSLLLKTKDTQERQLQQPHLASQYEKPKPTIDVQPCSRPISNTFERITQGQEVSMTQVDRNSSRLELSKLEEEKQPKTKIIKTINHRR